MCFTNKILRVNNIITTFARKNENIANACNSIKTKDIVEKVEKSQENKLSTSKALEVEAFKIVSQSLQLYKPTNMIFSFNGGKDCTVVLHLLYHFFLCHPVFKNFRMPVLYIQNDNSFEEVETFVDQMSTYFDMSIIKRKGNIKRVLFDVCNEMPSIKAVFMGNRRTDPFCAKAKALQFTDSDYPKLMRINPILDWNCADVWDYIRSNQVPYCNLYDKGYTSLGNKNNTLPNPHLKVVDSKTKKIFYNPAYKLIDNSLERAGRI